VQIHHLNCGTMCPWGGRLMDGVSKGATGRLVCHCLLIETDQGLVLIDTGLGRQDVSHPYPRLSRFYVDLLNIQLDPRETALGQIERLGYSARDVRHIILTHLDFDHAGGLEDFPEATVHLLSAELDAAEHRKGFVSRRRYRPRQWDDVHHWQQYEAGGEPWFGFDAVRSLKGLPPEILLIPLAGHTRGHAGVALQSHGGWLLHAGDAYFFRDEVGTAEPRCTPGLRAYQALMEVDRRARLHNQARLRALSLDAATDVEIFCAHDAVEYRRMAQGRERWLGRRPEQRAL
jgi:glyoxylase-like metal-dependent hydrolase (beta-lactamase superfamily II)